VFSTDEVKLFEANRKFRVMTHGSSTTVQSPQQKEELQRSKQAEERNIEHEELNVEQTHDNHVLPTTHNCPHHVR